MQSLYEQFVATAERFPQRVAIEVQRRDGLETYRYDELARMIEQAAAWLAARGVGPGDRCAILADNDARWCAAYLATLRLGAVAVPLDTAYKAGQVATVIGSCRARLILTTPRYLDISAQGAEAFAAASGEVCEPVLLTGRSDGRATLDDVWVGGGRGETLPPCPATRDDLAVILYTSGTTSDPKGVMLSHGNLLAEQEAVFGVVRIDERDAVLSVLPLFHALAQLANLILPLAVGARIVYLETVNTTELLRALQERDISAFCCVPQFFYLIHQRVTHEVSAAGWVERMAFRALLTVNGWSRAVLRLNLGPIVFARVHRVLGPRMRLLITGASRFDPKIGRDLYRLGFNILQAYGLTECAGAATVTRPGDRDLGAVGHPLPGIDVKIAPVDITDGTRPDGEVLIRGPIVMRGYYERPDATAAALKDGWLYTGDLGFLDRDGRLNITGRSKEVIVLSSGKNIYPEEIEAHYRQSPFIKEICVLGQAREGEPMAERLHAIVVPDVELLRDRRIVNTGEIVRFEIEGLSVQLPSHKRIQGYDISLDPLPRTTTGKLKRFEIQRQARERGATSDARAREWSPEELAWASDANVAAALKTIGEMAGRDTAVHPGANLELDLGLDSMERVELLTRLEQAFQTRVAREKAQKIFTVKELVDAVRPPGAAFGAPVDSPALVWGQLLAAAPQDDPTFAELLRPKTAVTLLFFLVVKVWYLLALLLLRARVRGRKHLPSSGPYLICPNHQSYLEVFVLVSALPFRAFRNLFFVGASEYFATPAMKRLARLINTIPVDPDANLLRAMQAGAFGLDHGKVLVLFPEGERSIDGAPRVFKKGAAILSVHLGAPIVPVALDGFYEIWPRSRPLNWKAFLPFAGTRVSFEFGAPLRPPSVSAGSGLERLYESHTEHLRSEVARMWEGMRAGTNTERALNGQDTDTGW
jgi:long-chain acyl-CoA synthetase